MALRMTVRRVMTSMVLALLAAVGASPAPATASDLPTPAAATLRQCVQANGSLSVVALIDESGSLKGTDPSNGRVAGLRTALAGLARLAEGNEDGPPPRVEVIFVGFAGEPNPDPRSKDAKLQWKPVTTATVDGLVHDAGDFSRRNGGEYTNYERALSASREILARRAGERTKDGGTAPPCKMLLWFTDGRYEAEGGSAAVAEGTRKLCKSGGVMDGFVGDDVIKFVVGLSIEPDARGLLQRLATGRSDTGEACGSRLSDRTGAYFDAADSSQLFFVFGSLLDGGGTVVDPPPPCPGRPAPRCETPLKIVAGLRSFVIRTSTGSQRVGIVLRGPDGTTTTLRPGDSRRFGSSGAEIQQRWVSPGDVEIVATLPRGTTAWQGNWSFALVDLASGTSPAKPAARLQLFADVAPVLAQRVALVRGAPTRVVLRLAAANGAPAQPSPVLESARLAATLGAPGEATRTALPLTPVNATDHTFEGTTRVGADDSSPLKVLTTEATFAPVAGVGVVPERRSFPLATRLPAGQGYPQISPTSLRLRSVKGKGSTTAVVTATASRDAAGCVWVGTPLGASEQDVSVEVEPDRRNSRDCVQLAKGESKRIEITFTTRDENTGTVKLDVPIGVRSALGGGDRTVSLPASFEQYPPPNIGKSILILISLTLAGVAVPLFVLWGLNRWTAWLSPPQLVRGFVQDVVITPGHDVLTPDGGALQSRRVSTKHLSDAGAPRPVRRSPVGPFLLTAVTARSLRDLFRGPYAVATANGEPILGGSISGGQSTGSVTEIRIPLTLARTWLFLPTRVTSREDGGAGVERVEGQLLFLVADAGDIDDGKLTVAEASARLEAHDWTQQPVGKEPTHFERLRARVAARDEDAGATQGVTTPLSDRDAADDDRYDY